MPTNTWRHENKDKLQSYRRKWYQKNRKHAINKSKERKRNIRKWLVGYKSHINCCVCGETHPSCLEFHHKDPSKKDLNISAVINQGWSIRRITTEINKCSVYCANCHRKLHYKETKGRGVMVT